MDIMAIVTQVGFPIAMCLYFMFRMEGILKELTKSQQLLTEVIRAKLKK